MSPNSPDPARARALVARGRDLERRRDHEAAAAAFAEAAECDPAHGPAFAELARVLERVNELPRARAAAERATALDPSDRRARLTLANLMRRAGELDASRSEFERALLGAGGANPGDAALAVAWNRYGLVLDALRDSESAIGAFARANEIRWSMPDAAGIDATAPIARVDATGAFLTPERVRAWDDGRDADEPDDPVFLAGFPRSGTTLTERLLGAHPDATILDEDSPIRETILRAREMVGGTPYPDVFDRVSPEQARALRAAYWSGIERRAPGAGGVLIDKVPLHLLDLAAIVRLFPRARMVLAIRDPRDVCVSAAMQLMVPNPAMAHLRTVEGAARLYARVMGMWLKVRGGLPNPVLESRYEDLVSDPEGAARRLVAFAGLGWDDSVLRFHERARGAFVATPSFEAVSQPISGGARGRWTRYERWLGPVMPELEPFLDAWGYRG